jgi:DNA-directed RNA polymerase subunit E'
MFKLVTLEDTIRIPPERFGDPIEAVGYAQLKSKYEGMVDEELGYVIAVTDIQINPVGKIIPYSLCSHSFQNFRKSWKAKLWKSPTSAPS